MSTQSDTRPCPFCGEEIKVAAVKCRYCNEFLHEQEEEVLAVAPVAPARKRRPRTLWATAAFWIGLLALIPLWLIVYFIFVGGGQRLMMGRLMYLASAGNVLLGVLAMVAAIAAFLALRKPGYTGLGTALCGAVLGFAGATLHPVFTWWLKSKFLD